MPPFEAVSAEHQTRLDIAQGIVDEYDDAGTDAETKLSDLLADLIHWSRSQSLDFDSVVRHAEQTARSDMAEWEATL